MINKEKVLIFDGAMGTYYPSVAKEPLGKCELANIYDRTTILKIHKAYIDAGSRAIRTNTFGANKVSLQDDFDRVKEVIVKGYEIAKEATDGTDVLIFADIGPIPATTEADLFESYKEIVDVYLELGLKYFIFETFSSDQYLEEISQYIKTRNPEAYILIGFAVSPEGYTRLGESGKKLMERISQLETVDACGFNCFSGPRHLLDYIKTIDTRGKKISIMPNSGYPTIINNRTFFDNTKEYFGAQMLEIVKEGASIIGGCCGTTPDYIKDVATRIQNLSLDGIDPKVQEKKVLANKVENKNLLLDKIESGKKIIAVELDPPLDTDIDFFMTSAKSLKGQGVDAITIADCPIARARVDSSLLACKLKRELDMTTIPHMTCRDRNINATKALLLGLNIEGVNNVLVVTGDPIPTAQRDEIKAMFDFNSAILAKYITNLNETAFSAPFNICGALNVNARNFKHQLARAKKKIENGVTMFLTQPIFTQAALENLILARKELPAKILGGIMPIVSYRNACFMNNEISGIDVSEEIIAQYKDITRDEATKLAVKISTQTIDKISPYIDGYYIVTPFKRIDLVSDIVAYIKSQDL